MAVPPNLVELRGEVGAPSRVRHARFGHFANRIPAVTRACGEEVGGIRRKSCGMCGYAAVDVGGEGRMFGFLDRFSKNN